MFICRCGVDTMYAACSVIYSYVHFHAAVPFVSFFSLTHFWVLAPESFFSRRCRNLSMVDSSGIGRLMISPANRRIDSISYKAPSIAGSLKFSNVLYYDTSDDSIRVSLAKKRGKNHHSPHHIANFIALIHPTLIWVSIDQRYR